MTDVTELDTGSQSAPEPTGEHVAGEANTPGGAETVLSVEDPAADEGAPEAPDRSVDEAVLPGRLARLLAELRDENVPALAGAPEGLAALVELSYALRPHVHEGRVPTYGSIVTTRAVFADRWTLDNGVAATLVPVSELDIKFARRFADGLATFAVRSHDSITHMACFSRDMSAEYDLVGLQDTMGGLVIQRHPGGQVRLFGPAGVVRWDGISWHHDPPLEAWIQRLRRVAEHLPVEALLPVLRFAIHELGGRRIGASLIWRPGDPEPPAPLIERLVHNVPRLRLEQRGEAASIAQALSQTDGAALFSGDGVLLSIGIRLAPTLDAAMTIPAMGGMRHTSALRYSFDDPDCVVIVVSDDGPVTIMHNGRAIANVDPGDDAIG